MIVRYKNISVKVDKIKPTICSCCKKKAKPRGLHMHHTCYNYTPDEVRNNPELATHNTIYLCYFCHRVANSIRIVQEHSDIFIKLKGLIE